MAYDPDRVVQQMGKRVAHLRRERKLSQGDLAKKLRTTPQWVSQVERGARSSTLHTVVKLANALNVSLAELLEE